MDSLSPYYDILNPTPVPPIPDVTGLDLPGQLQGVPGGFASDGTIYMSDPSGISAIYTDDTVSPNNTGAYLDVAKAIAQAASGAFIAYNKGSVSAAVPQPKAPVSALPGSFSIGGTTVKNPFNGKMIIAVAAAAIGVILVIELL